MTLGDLLEFTESLLDLPSGLVKFMLSDSPSGEAPDVSWQAEEARSRVMGTGMGTFTPCCSCGHFFPGVHTSKPPTPPSKHIYFVVELFHLGEMSCLVSSTGPRREIAQWVKVLASKPDNHSFLKPEPSRVFSSL